MSYNYTPYPNYSPYGNYGYQAQMQQRGQMAMQQPQQPMMMAQPQQMQPPFESPIQELRFVTSEEAKAFIVMPNSRALLIDKNGGIAHLKSADNMGQSLTKYFKFQEVTADGLPLTPQDEAPKIDLASFEKKFISIEQYEELVKQFNSMAEQLANIKKMMAGGKVNVNPGNPKGS